MTARAWTVVIYGPDGQVWSANEDHRRGHHAVARHRAAVREEAGWAAKAERVPPLGRARVAITIHLRNWRQADAQNYSSAATVKAALDGLVDAGVVPDDRAEFLDVAMPKLAPLGGDRRPRVVLTVTEATP